MKHKKKIIIPFVILLVLFLIILNKDILRFTYDTPRQRTFVPEVDEKRDYIVNGPVILKPGSYELSLDLTVEGNDNGVFLVDGDENIIFYTDMPNGTINPVFPFEISGSTKQVRIGIRYDSGSAIVSLERVKITAEHILYRESLLRHLMISILIVLFAVWLFLRLYYPSILWKLFPPFAKPENELTLLCLILLTAAVSYPVLNGKVYIHGDDMFFHVTRIKGLADSLKAGYFPVRDQLYWLNNYGYGVGYFYPDVFLYFPALLVLLGFNLLTAYNIFLILCTFFSIVSIWYASLRITNNRTSAAASAIFIACAAYRLNTIYYRAAVGEVQAAMFYPLIVLGLYELFHDHTEKWPVFAVGFLGILCCHLISLSIAVVLTALFLLTQLRKILKDRRIFISLMKSVLTVIAIDAFFLLPMLEQSLTNPELKINQVMTGDAQFNVTNYAIPFDNLFIRFKPWSGIWQADSTYPGWSMLLVLLLGIMVWKKREWLVKTADFILLFSIPLILAVTRLFPWQWGIFLPFVSRIQFAYRMLLPVTVLMSLSGGIYFAALTENRKQYIWLFVLFVFCFFSTANPILLESVRNRTVEKRMFVMQDNRVSGAEYLPPDFDESFPGKNMDTVRLAESDIPLTITAHKRQKLGFSFTYEIPENSGEVHFSVPLVYYTGFRGTLTAEDGAVIQPEITWDDMGLVSLGNGGHTRGTVAIVYQKTPVQWIGECITFLSISAVFLRKRTVVEYGK